jgi:Flp pilus assembly protein TadG
MRSSAARRSRESGSVLILFTFMLPFLLIPMVGLAIDATMARIVQLKIQSAVDAAATGSGRLLGQVPDNKIVPIAQEFLKSNFLNGNVAGTWGAYNLVSVPGTDIVYTSGIKKTISVTARANVPLLFMRIFSLTDAVVASVGVATRTDSRIMFVLDRSGSMNTSDGAGSTVIADAKANALTFLQNFSNTDEIGLVVFDSGAAVGYPTYAAGGYSTAIPTIAPYGGPDTLYANGAATDMLHQISSVAAGGGTGMAEAISLAYIELQKAHMRDLKDPNNVEGKDTRLNTIVLLTDGSPTAISFYLNRPDKIDGTQNADDMVKNTACNFKTIPLVPAPTAANMMRGVFVISGSPPFSTSDASFGIWLIPSMDTAHSSSWWMTNAGQNLAPPAAPFAGCPAGLASSSSSSTNPDAKFTGNVNVPSSDAWGNALVSPMDIANNAITGYTNSQIVGGTVGSVYDSRGPLVRTQLTGNYNWGLTMWNSVDQAAARIRQDLNKVNRIGDTDDPMKIGFEVIGYTGNGGVDVGLLKRVANDPTAVGFFAGQPNGMYYSAGDKAGLAAAFASVASDLLRLAR